MLIDINSAQNSPKFGWLIEELEIIESTFTEYLESGYELVRLKDNILEANRLKAIENLTNSDYTHDRFLYEKNRVSNYYLEHSFTFAGVSYLYSQLETKLIEIKNSNRDCFISESNNCNDNYKNKELKNKSKLLPLVKYIKSQNKISFTGEFQTNWRIICDFNKVRNRIVHNNGMCTDVFIASQIISNCKKYGLKTHNNEIVITYEYLVNITRIVCLFLTKLMEMIWKKSNI